MRILIAAGGTAGHINPALAIASEIKKNIPAAQVHFAGRKTGMEAKLVKNAGYGFHEIEVRGFQRKLSPKNILRNFAAIYYLAMSLPRAKTIIKSIKPDLVIGTGGYVSGPVVRAAVKMGIKTAIHEQNAYPGITNKMLAKEVNLVLAASKDAKERLLAQGKTVVVGNPIRSEFFLQDRQKARDALSLKNDDLLILSFGGSLGAMRVNEAVAKLAVWEKTKPDIVHIHATGSIEKEDFEEMAKAMQIDNSPRFIIKEYIDNMPQLLSAADLVISRAGALTLAEIAASGKASVLIPSPNVAENHQYHNAMRLERAGAAVVIEEKDLKEDSLQKIVEGLVANRATVKSMGVKALALSSPNCTAEIYEQLKKLMGK